MTPSKRRARNALLLVVPLAVALATALVASAAGIGLQSASLTTLTAPVTAPAAGPTVTLNHPGDHLRGTVTVSAVATPGASPIASVVIQRSSDGVTWTTICTSSASPYSCVWDTTKVTDGDYDLRAVATDTAARTGTSATVAAVVDNTPPSVTMVDPGSPLRGTVLLSATATDATSGVSSVRIEWAPAGTSTWATSPGCAVVAAPYVCYLETTSLAYGLYDFRAIAVDVAGNPATSNTIRNRLVDNSQSSITMLDPGLYLRGPAVPLTAVPTVPAGVTVSSVTIQVAPSGSAVWTTACVPAAAPYQCTWNSTTVPDGLYDFRAVLVESLGNTRISNVVTGRRVDNSPMRGFDVQATNGGSAAGLIEVGDSVTFTYTEMVDPATVLAGWTGTAQTVVVRVRDGGAVGTGGAGDTLDAFTTTSFTAPVNVGSVNLFGNYVRRGRTLVFNATMIATQVTVNGQPATAISIQLTAPVAIDGARSAGGTPTMVWTPSAAARDLAGNSCSTAPVTELATIDRDF